MEGGGTELSSGMTHKWPWQLRVAPQPCSPTSCPWISGQCPFLWAEFGTTPLELPGPSSCRFGGGHLTWEVKKNPALGHDSQHQRLTDPMTHKLPLPRKPHLGHCKASLVGSRGAQHPSRGSSPCKESRTSPFCFCPMPSQGVSVSSWL